MKKLISSLFGCICIFQSLAGNASTIIDNSDEYVLSGVLRSEILSLVGSTSSILIDLGFGLQDSGEITLELNSSGDNYFEYDFNLGTVVERLELFITSPLLLASGFSPIPILIEEFGNIDSVMLFQSALVGNALMEEFHEGYISSPDSSPQASNGSWNGTMSQPDDDIFSSFEIHATLTGGGTVNQGPFSGFTYENFQDTIVTVNLGGSKNGNVKTADEPTTILLMIFGLLGILKLSTLNPQNHLQRSVIN